MNDRIRAPQIVAALLVGLVSFGVGLLVIRGEVAWPHWPRSDTSSTTAAEKLA